MSRIQEKIAVGLGVAVMLTGVASAQNTGVRTGVRAKPKDKTAVATSKSASVKPANGVSTYKISKDDSIFISCMNDPQYTMLATVLPDGTISYPKAGQIVVAGKTPREVEAILAGVIRKDFVRPQVSVSVRERQVRQVAVTGSGVKTTGKRIMRDGWHVLDALSDAGGLISDRTDLFTARLIRLETKEVIPIDLSAVYQNSDSSANMLLEPNDLLIVDSVDESRSQIQVTGEVFKPGAVLIPRDHTVSKALQDAGGVKPSALLSEAVIERNGTKIPIDLRQYVKDGSEPEVRLQPGDKLVVPENRRLVYMVGAFNRQGATLIPDDRPMTLVQAISDAGVPLQQAETKKTQVIRAKPDGTQVATTVNVEEMLKKADLSKNIVLLPGDIVYIPFKNGRKFGIMDGVSSLGALGGLVNLRYLFSR